MCVKGRAKRWFAGGVAAAALAGGCASQSAQVTTADDVAASEGVADSAGDVADDSAPIELPEIATPPSIPSVNPPVAPEPPEGSLVMGRANWSSGYAHAQIIHDLVEELGYQVTDPSERETSPDLAYQRMATGAIDFWANSWYPGHLSWWEGELPSGSRVGDQLMRVEPPMSPDAGLQGWLVTKSWAETNDVTTLDQINADPDLWQQLDSDGNGLGEFYGCPPDWTCDDIMHSTAVYAEWNNLEQVQRGYDAMFDDFLAAAARGEPAIIYTWAPTDYVARAELGETTMWISILDDSVLDDSNPLQIDYGGVVEWCQRCDGVVGFKNLGPDVCLHGPDGCQLGWNAATIEITANRDWLAEYPDVAELFRQVRFSGAELSGLVLAAESYGLSDDAVERAAAEWMVTNRHTVDEWLARASAVD